MIRLKRRLFFIAAIWIVAVASLEVTLRCVYFQSKASEISAIKLFSVRSIDRIRRGFGKVGVDLNREGWTQSFTERGLPVPPGGPREDYWGWSLGTKRQHSFIGWTEAPQSKAEKYTILENGTQVFGPADADLHLLFVGGSVAFGAYASREDLTYCSLLQRLLQDKGFSTKVTVLAAGAWQSRNEVAAIFCEVDQLKPDVLLMLDGLNDLTNSPIGTAESYVSNMRITQQVCKSRGISLCLLLQPFLLLKRSPTELESRIIELSVDDPEKLRREFGSMRTGLNGLTGEDTFCVDTSDCFSLESSTTFCDLWHFSDPGHRMLAEFLAENLLPVLAGRPGGH